MPQGKGTYGSKVGRPKKQKNSTDNYAQTETGKGMNSTDNMNDGAIDKALTPKQPRLAADLVQRKQKIKRRKAYISKSKSIKKIKKQRKIGSYE